MKTTEFNPESAARKVINNYLLYYAQQIKGTEGNQDLLGHHDYFSEECSKTELADWLEIPEEDLNKNAALYEERHEQVYNVLHKTFATMLAERIMEYDGFLATGNGGEFVYCDQHFEEEESSRKEIADRINNGCFDVPLNWDDVPWELRADYENVSVGDQLIVVETNDCEAPSGDQLVVINFWF